MLFFLDELSVLFIFPGLRLDILHSGVLGEVELGFVCLLVGLSIADAADCGGTQMLQCGHANCFSFLLFGLLQGKAFLLERRSLYLLQNFIVVSHGRMYFLLELSRAIFMPFAGRQRVLLGLRLIL